MSANQSEIRAVPNRLFGVSIDNFAGIYLAAFDKRPFIAGAMK